MQTETDDTPRPPRPAHSAAAARVGGGVGVVVSEDDAKALRDAASLLLLIDGAACAEDDAERYVGGLEFAEALPLAEHLQGMAALATPTPTPAVADALALVDELCETAADARAESDEPAAELAERWADAVRALAGQLARARNEAAGWKREHDLAETLAEDVMRERDDVRARLAAAERVGEVAGEAVARVRELASMAPNAASVMGLDAILADYDAAGAPFRARGEPAGERGLRVEEMAERDALTPAETLWLRRNVCTITTRTSDGEEREYDAFNPDSLLDEDTSCDDTDAVGIIRHLAPLPARPSTPAAEGESNG